MASEATPGNSTRQLYRISRAERGITSRITHNEDFKMSLSKERFYQLTEGLLFMSETDAPLTYIEMGLESSQQWPPSTVGQFLQLIGEDPATPVEGLAPAKFFESLLPGNEEHEDQVIAFRRAM